MRRESSSFVRSAGMPWAVPPAAVISFTTRSTPAASMSITATCAPSRAKRRAPARPMPEAAAVTIPIFPARRMAGPSWRWTGARFYHRRCSLSGGRAQPRRRRPPRTLTERPVQATMLPGLGTWALVPPTTEEEAMTTRREFLQIGAGALAGIAFVGCDLLAAPAARAQSRRREVVVNGRRTKTVDVHAHCAVPEAMALMNLKILGPGTPLPPLLHVAAQAADRLRAMDEQGIDVEALSINPYWYKADRDLAKQIIAMQNEKLAEACAAHPDRFVAFATVALQHPDLAAEQLEEGV